MALQRDIDRYKQAHPGASDATALRHIVKYCVPDSLPGTPAWHRSQLADLKAMVEVHGLPSFFMTLTADEVSGPETRWEEISDMEAFMDRFNAGFDWSVSAFHHT